MKKTIMTLALVTGAVSGMAFAEEPSFTYVEGGYSSWEDFDGEAVRGSYAINDLLYLKGSLEVLNDEIAGNDLDLTTATFGIGVKMPLGDSTAVYADLSYLDYEAESDFSDLSEDGYIAATGIRSMVTDSTELYGEVAHVNIDSDSKTELNLGARQYFTNNFGVFAEYSVDDFDNNGFTVGATFKF